MIIIFLIRVSMHYTEFSLLTSVLTVTTNNKGINVILFSWTQSRSHPSIEVCITHPIMEYSLFEICFDHTQHSLKQFSLIAKWAWWSFSKCLSQCFSTFFDSRHPSFLIEQFCSTPNYNSQLNRRQIHKLAAPLEFFTAPKGSATPVENHCFTRNEERKLITYSELVV